MENVAKIEAVIHRTSRLTTICQNENNLNASNGPVVRNTIQDGLSRVSLKVIDAHTWSKNKSLMYPSKIDTDTDDFTIVGKTFLTKSLL